MSSHGLDLEGAPDQPLKRDVAWSLATVKPTGRPSELTEEVAELILDSVAAGSFLTVAAAKAGVSNEAVQGWIRRGLGDAAAGLDTLFVRFGQAYSRAKHQAEADAVASLQRGGDGKYRDWRAQAWWLERRHKERWSLPKEGAATGITLALSNEQLAGLADALRVATAKTIELEPMDKPSKPGTPEAPDPQAHPVVATARAKVNP